MQEVENRRAYRARREAAAAAGHEPNQLIPNATTSNLISISASGVGSETGAFPNGDPEEENEEDEGTSGQGAAYSAERRKLRDQITALEDKLQVEGSRFWIYFAMHQLIVFCIISCQHVLHIILSVWDELFLQDLELMLLDDEDPEQL